MQNSQRARRFVIVVPFLVYVAGLFLASGGFHPSRLAAQEVSALAAARAFEQLVIDAIAKAEKSVVAIARVRKLPTQADLSEDDDARMFFPARPLRRLDPESPEFAPNDYGSGVVVDRQGLIVTNYHVLGDIESSLYWVWIGRKPYSAQVKAADPWLDLAVLKIAADHLEPMTLGDAKNVKKGQIVISLGNPQSIAKDGQPSATWGIVSNLSRKSPTTADAARQASGRDTLHHYGTLIQTDTKLPLGTSGGALVNLQGEMIGLTTSLAALESSETSAGFAIPVDETFKRTLDTLKSGRKAEYGFLGVAPEPLPFALQQTGRHGVRINQIVRGTPAEQAGFLSGDIITHIGDVAIHDDLDLIREISKAPAEAEIQIKIERGPLGKLPAKAQVVAVHLSKKHLAGARPEFAETPDPIWRGIRVDHATAVPMFGFRLPEVDPKGCVAVLDVQKDSPSWKAGLRPGNFISHVEEQRVATPREFFAAVAKLQEAVQIRLTTGGPNDSLRTVLAP